MLKFNAAKLRQCEPPPAFFLSTRSEIAFHLFVAIATFWETRLRANYSSTAAFGGSGGVATTPGVGAVTALGLRGITPRTRGGGVGKLGTAGLVIGTAGVVACCICWT